MTTSLDERWFESVRNISSLVDEAEWFQRHIRVSEEERDMFLDNEIENPRFLYTKSPAFMSSTDAIRKLHTEIQANEKDAVVLDLYTHKLAKLEQRSDFLQALIEGKDADFYQASVKLYGKPKKKYFSYVAKQITALCKKNQAVDPVVAKRLQRVVSKIDQSNIDISADILPPVVDTGKEITTVAEVKEIFQAALDRLNIENWTVQVGTGSARTRFSVSPFRQIVNIPSQAQLALRPKKLTDVHIEALAEHEVGVHARRAYEGGKSSLKLLQVGLDSYLPGEEGLAGYVQQQIEGADEFYGFDRYFAACLATGMDGTKRDFRAVFSIMTDYYTLKYAAAEKVDEAPFRAAWDVCVGIFRGTTGQTPGTICTKDIVYMEGNINIWHLISDRPHIFESLFIGKFNPLLSRHVKSLQTLGILKEW
jgi:hypothetical protein